MSEVMTGVPQVMQKPEAKSAPVNGKVHIKHSDSMLVWVSNSIATTASGSTSTKLARKDLRSKYSVPGCVVVEL